MFNNLLKILFRLTIATGFVRALRKFFNKRKSDNFDAS
jgi:hypothetical protein